MKKFAIISFALTGLLAFGCQNGLIDTSAQAADDGSKAFTTAGFTLAWADEFNGSALNSAVWTCETGGGGWGNNELEYYRAENATVSGGYLNITAKRESYGGYSFTSARIKTQDKYTVQYGKVAARIKMPKGGGMWPAFWMLGSSISDVGWPKCGEIDIAEMAGGQGGAAGDRTTYSTCHWDSNGHAMYGKTYDLGTALGDAFHVYEVEWDSKYIRGRIDGTEYYAIDIGPADLSAFQSSFFILFNLAVGGTFFSPAITSPSGVTATMPQTMQVDWVRVYKADGSIGPGPNLITNPGFESEGPTQNPSGWSTWTPAGEVDSDFTETYGGAHAGTYHLTHYRAAPYKVWTYQIKTGLASGNYTFRAWVKSSGGQYSTFLQAKNYNSSWSYIQQAIPQLSGWTQITIANIPVANGQCEVGFYSDAAAYQWIHMDDVEFFKQ